MADRRKRFSRAGPRRSKRISSSASESGGHHDGQHETTPAQPEYACLQPRTKRVAQDVVRKKWVRPPPALQSRIRELFKAAETPVIMGVRDGRQRIEAQNTLDALIKRMNARVPRIPLPPNTKEMHLDYERLLAANRALEAQLTPTSHTIELFSAEIERERKRLRDDRARLDTLKKDSKTELSMHKRQGNNVHPILRRVDAASAVEDREILGENSVAQPVDQQGLLKFEDNPTLAPVIEQLRNHLGSIYSSTSFLEGFDERQIRVRAAVDDLLYHRLERLQYEKLRAS